MKLKSLTPMLRTKDLKGSVAFYSDVLGFTCDKLAEDAGWASLKKDEVGIMLATPNDHYLFDTANFTGSFYIHTDDVDKVWERLKDKTKICYPLETFDYGMREFGIFDNNGYLLQFGQPAKDGG